MRVFLVDEVHKAGISCLHWSRNAMKLFSGDTKGCVVCTEVDYTKVWFAGLSVLYCVHDRVVLVVRQFLRSVASPSINNSL